METKQEFIDGLRRALVGRISQEEIEEHIRYYEDYITAETRIVGAEKTVLDKLGEPRLIAMSICAADAAESQNRNGNGTGNADSEFYNSYSRNTGGNDYSGYESYNTKEEGTNQRKKDKRPFVFRHPKLTIAMILIVMIVVLILVIVLAFSLLKFLWPVIVVAAVSALIIYLMNHYS